MNILDYLKKLLPSISKKDVLEDLRISEQELETSIGNSYTAALEFFKGNKFKSKANKDLDDKIRNILLIYRKTRSANFIEDFAEMIPVIATNVTPLSKAIEVELSRDVVTEAVTSCKIALIRAADNVSYLCLHILDILNLVYVNEAEALGSDISNIKITDKERKRALESMSSVAHILGSMAIEPTKFKSLIEKGVDVIITRGDINAANGIYTNRELDPLSGQSQHEFDGSPMYHVRLFIAEWQIARYKSNQEKKKVLELRLVNLHLKRDKDGSNPAIDKEIRVTQERVQKLAQSLAASEEGIL